VQKISETDIVSLNTILGKMKEGVRLNSHETYMGGKNIEFKNKEEKIEFDSALRWNIVAVIQGYKTSASNRSSPIWKISQAFETI
jgi:hypothetical protein